MALDCRMMEYTVDDINTGQGLGDGTWIYVHSLLTLNRLRSVSSDIWLSSDREHHM